MSTDFQTMTLFELSDQMAQECFAFNSSRSSNSHRQIASIRHEFARRDREAAQHDREVVQLYRENRTLLAQCARAERSAKRRKGEG